MKLAKQSFKIDDSQIRTLIRIRDERRFNQVTLYEKIGRLVGRTIKHLRNLKHQEAEKVIQKFEEPEIKTRDMTTEEIARFDIPANSESEQTLSTHQELNKSLEEMKNEVKEEIRQEIEKSKVVPINEERKLTFAEIRKRHAERLKNGDNNA